jgi:hypothetical protein
MTQVTPSAWIYEDSSVNIRKYILENYDLQYFYQFENRKGIFHSVHRSYKFALFQVHKMAEEEKSMLKDKILPVRFMKTDINILYENKGKNEVLYYPYKDVYELSPEYLSFFEVKNQKDLELLRKSYERFQSLNPDYFDFRRELDMTNDRDLFEETPNDLILYEGKMIHQFVNNWAEPQYWVKKESFEERMKVKEINRLIKQIYKQLSKENQTETNQKKAVLDYLDIEEKDLENFISLDANYLRLCFRGIAGNTNERTLIAGIIPKNHTFGHSMFGHIPKKYLLENKKITIKTISLEKILFMQSILNSIVFDYLARFLVDINVIKSIVMRLPFPQPKEEELLENETYKAIIINALKLNLMKNPNLKESLLDLKNKL